MLSPLELVLRGARTCGASPYSGVGSPVLAPPDGPDTSTYLTLTACTTHRTRTSTAPPGDRSIRGGADGSYPRGLLPHLPPKGLLGARIYLEKAYPTSWNSSFVVLVVLLEPGLVDRRSTGVQLFNLNTSLGEVFNMLNT